MDGRIKIVKEQMFSYYMKKRENKERYDRKEYMKPL